MPPEPIVRFTEAELVLDERTNTVAPVALKVSEFAAWLLLLKLTMLF